MTTIAVLQRRTNNLPSVGCRPAPTTLAQMRRPDS
jgi:hypothetical protein